jgi:hypothetical protein
MKEENIFSGLITIYAIVAWFVNVFQLISCDFAPPYKQEFIHLIGLIPGASIITCWC